MPIGFYLTAVISVLIFLYVIYKGIDRLIYLYHQSRKIQEKQNNEELLKQLFDQYEKIKQEQEQTKIELANLLAEIGKQKLKEQQFENVFVTAILNTLLSKLSNFKSSGTYVPSKNLFNERIGTSTIKYRQPSYEDVINSPYKNEIFNN
jgi:ABC-type bacteriocin/lantibiotic exporter with double-glycine peptidase domain